MSELADPFRQSGEVWFDWGLGGATYHLQHCTTLIVVDVLSFTTAVDVAVGRGAAVYPFRWDDPRASAFAERMGAHLAVGRLDMSTSHPYSLSPRSLEQLPAGQAIVLPSPNGSEIAARAAEARRHLLAGSLRNRSSVARAALELGGPVCVIASGERWPDGSMRPAYEDLIGAGAIVQVLTSAGLEASVEARAAAGAFEDARPAIAERLSATGSARELAAMGFENDVTIAAQLDGSSEAPCLRDDAFRRRPSTSVPREAGRIASRGEDVDSLSPESAQIRNGRARDAERLAWLRTPLGAPRESRARRSHETAGWSPD